MIPNPRRLLDASNGSGLSNVQASGNRLGKAMNQSGLGYLAEAVTMLANFKVWALALTEGADVIPIQGQPLQMVGKSPTDILADCKIAAQGSSAKSYALGVFSATAATALVLNPLAATVITRVCGLRIKISDSLTTFRPGAFYVSIVDTASAGAVNSQLVIYPTKACGCVEVIVMGISNLGGQAQIAPIGNPTLTFANSGDATNPSSANAGATNVWVESINMRDIGALTGTPLTSGVA
jgi:hypothetical protein